MHIRNRKIIRQPVMRHITREAEARKIVIALRQHMMAKGFLLDEFQIAAVVDAIGADDDEGDFIELLIDALRRLHEDVKPAHHLKPAGDVGDDAMVIGNLQLPAHALQRIGLAVVDGGVDAVENHLDLAPQLGRKEFALIMCRRPAAIAVHHIQQDHRVAGFAAQQAQLIHRNFRPEPHVLPDGMVEKFQEIDQRRVKQVGHEQR